MKNRPGLAHFKRVFTEMLSQCQCQDIRIYRFIILLIRAKDSTHTTFEKAKHKVGQVRLILVNSSVIKVYLDDGWHGNCLLNSNLAPDPFILQMKLVSLSWLHCTFAIITFGFDVFAEMSLHLKILLGKPQMRENVKDLRAFSRKRNIF